jgi:tetratricopeptide (TPR) repeat protein
MNCLNEQTVLEFLEVALGGEQRIAVEQHLADCPTCLDLVTAAAPLLRSSAPAQGAVLPRGMTLGRYVILGQLGRGAMGEVYGAYDPELDRKVALKLLAPAPNISGDPAAARARLLREAKAMASVSHPNVVGVHDVGAVGDRVFIAMEFVEGGTLAAWLRSGKRGWQEVLRAYVGAGRGLAAAHAAGLVHRDFKPHNVMMDREGNVRVTDFGLVRRLGADERVDQRAEDPAANTPERLDESAGEPPRADLTLTRTGTLLGTPRYMSPEQLVGAPADARSDQFSFCVGLYESLYGEHPFGAADLGTLRAAVLSGQVAPTAARSQVPAAVRKVILRGLSRAPQDRFPSMRALLDALGGDPARRRRRALFFAAAAIAAVAVVAAVKQAGDRNRALCRAAPARLAGSWELPGLTPGDARRRRAVEAAFVGSTVPGAAIILAEVESALDRYAREWTGMYTEACEATHVRGEQSPELLDLRMSCLGNRLVELDALTNVLSQANATAVQDALEGVNALRRMGACADVQALRAVVQPPDDRVRARVDQIRRQAAALRAMTFTGQNAEAQARLGAVLADARSLNYRPLIAELLFAKGLAEEGAGNRAASEETFVAAWAEAEASRDDRTAAEAAVLAYGEASLGSGSSVQTKHWYRLADAALARLGRRDDVLESWLMQSRAVNELTDGNWEGARLDVEKAVALKRRALGPDNPDTGIALANLAVALLEERRCDEALQSVTKSIDLMTRGFGPQSSRVAVALSNRGEALNCLGRYREAEEPARRSLAIWTLNAGAEHPHLAYPLTTLGISLIGAGKGAAATAPLERALALRAHADVPQPVLAETQFALARALALSGRAAVRSRARTLANSARAIYAAAPHREARMAEIDAWLEEQIR